MSTRVGQVFLTISLLALACAERRPLRPVEPFSLGLHERWEDAEAEALALCMSGDLIASRDLYDRVHADLAAVRETWGDSIPEIRTIRFLPPMELSWISIGVDSDARTRILNGEHREFDSLNSLYEALSVEFGHFDSNGVTISFSPLLNPCQLFLPYARLEGVRAVYGNGMASLIGYYIFPMQSGDTIRYFFQAGRGGGFGSRNPIYHYFESTSLGQRYLGMWDTESRDSTPNWHVLVEEAQLNHFRCKDESYKFVDVTPPATVRDLRVMGVQEGAEVTISFTMTGDDGWGGLALNYSVIAAHEPITDSNWNSVGYRTISYAAGRPGDEMAVTVSVDGHGSNYIGIRVHDGSNNWSRISNNVVTRNIWLDGWTYFTTENSKLPSDATMAMSRDSGGRFWVLTGKGVVQIDREEWNVFTNSNSLLPDSVATSVAEGADGVMWFGSRKGLARFDGSNWQNFTTQNSGLPKQEIACVGVGADGDVWLGYGSSGYGLVRYDGMDWTRYTPANSPMQGYSVHSILGARTGHMWIATQSALHRLGGEVWDYFTTSNSGINSSQITSLSETHEGHMLSGASNKTLGEFDGTGWTVRNVPGTPRSFTQEQSGVLWVATLGGLWRKEGSTTRVFDSQNTGLPANQCTGIAIDDSGGLWIATATNGLCRWDLKSAKLDGSPQTTAPSE